LKIHPRREASASAIKRFNIKEHALILVSALVGDNLRLGLNKDLGFVKEDYAGIVVGHVGTTPITKQELLEQ